MVYGFVRTFFPAVDSSAKTEGNVPLPPLRKGSQATCVPGSQGNKPCLGSPGSQAGGDGWGQEMSRVGDRLEAGQKVAVSPVAEGSTQGPGGDGT